MCMNGSSGYIFEQMWLLKQPLSMNLPYPNALINKEQKPYQHLLLDKSNSIAFSYLALVIIIVHKINILFE